MTPISQDILMTEGFLVHLVINQRVLYNHALSVISVGVGIVGVICAHLPWHMVRHRNIIFSIHMHTCPPCMHTKYLVILSVSFLLAAILVLFFDLLSYPYRQS